MSSAGGAAMAGRDPRLDFFRGLAMFIIFIAHVPHNPWTLWIPARFGFSDATEIFVFCSGMASAFAFGRIYTTRNWFVGAARTLYRAWEIYWVHIGLFIALAATLAALDAWGAFGERHLASLNLLPFFARPAESLIGLITLTYVPNYFDILPMYFGVLLMLPLVVAARKIGVWAAAVLVLAVWLATQFGAFHLRAEPWSERGWFFNPFGWQLIFFTGFAFASGWIKPPPVKRAYVIAAIIVLAASIPFSYFRLLEAFPPLRAAANELAPLTAKSPFGVLRYVHFLALAYVAYAAAGPRGARLQGVGPLRVVTAIIHKVGQQALATFVAGMYAARLAPIAFTAFGLNAASVLAVNLAGMGLLIATAYVVAWFRAEKAAQIKRRSAPLLAEPQPAPYPRDQREAEKTERREQRNAELG